MISSTSGVEDVATKGWIAVDIECKHIVLKVGMLTAS